MLPKSFACSDDDDESASSIPVDDCEPNLIGPKDCPISINEYASTRIELPNLTWHGYSNTPQCLILANTGESVQITGKWGRGKPYVTGGPLNGSYMFSQIHFHMPSEHSLNEKRYPLEMHAVHYKSSYLTQKRAMKKNDGTVVVVYFFEVAGRCATGMSKLTEVLSRVKQKNCSVEICNSNLEDFMKTFCSNYFIYWGTAEIGESRYSLQWIISCKRLIISEREYCELEYFFGEGPGGKMKRSMRETKPNLCELYLVGDTVVRTCSEGHRSEVRFSETGRLSEASEKSRSCCFLNKLRSSSCGSRDKDSWDKKVKQIYPSTCKKESYCSHCVNKSVHNRSTCVSNSPEKCIADKQTSTGSVCRCSFRGECKGRDRSRSRSSVSSHNDSEIESSSLCKRGRTVRTCNRKVGNHDCIENGCRRETCGTDESTKTTIRNFCNRAKKSYAKCKRRIMAKEDTSSDTESTDRSACLATCEVVTSAIDGREILKCDVVCSKLDRKSSETGRNEKKSKRKCSEVGISKDKKNKQAKPKKKKKNEKSCRGEQGKTDTDSVSDESSGKKGKQKDTCVSQTREKKEDKSEAGKAKGNKTTEQHKDEPKSKATEQHKDEPKTKAPEQHKDEPKPKAPEQHKDEPKTKATEEHKDQPKTKAPEEHKDEPKTKAPEQHKDEPKTKAPEQHKDEPKPKAPEQHKDEPKPKAPEEHKDEPKPKASEEHKDQPKTKAPEEHKDEPKPKATEQHKDEPKPKATEQHKDEPKTKAPEEHKDQPKTKAPEEHKDEPKPKATEQHKDEPKTKAPEEHKDQPKTKAPEQHKESGKSQEANAGEKGEHGAAREGPTATENNSKQMGQHKPVILAPATMDDNTFILKSVGTMTASVSHPSQSEGKNLAEERYSTEESISNTEIWKKDKHSRLPRTSDKITDIPEAQEQDQESNSSQARDNKSSTSLSKAANEEETNNVAGEQSLFSMLEKMSNDPSLNNFLKRISNSENQKGEDMKEQSIGSILAKMSKDSSLACMLSKISREVLTMGESGTKTERAAPKFERILRESSMSSDSEKTESDSDTVTEIYGKTSAVRGFALTSTDEETMTDSGNPRNRNLTVVLDDSATDHKVASKNFSRHSTRSSKLSVRLKEPSLASPSVKNAQIPGKESEAGVPSKDSLIRVSRSARIQSEPVVADASSKPSLTSSTKERSLVRVLMKVSREPLLGVELTSLLQPQPEGQSRPKTESVGNILFKLSREPSLAADLANILGEHSNKSVDLRTSSIMRAVKSSKEKSLANILTAVSRKASMIPGGSRENSVVDIVRKISREPSVVCDVANILNRDSQYSGSVRLREELLASVSAELADETVKSRSSGNCSKRDSRSSNQSQEVRERSSSSISSKTSKNSSLGLRTEALSESPKREQSPAVISDKVSKEQSSSQDFASASKIGQSSFDSEKSAKQGTKNKVSADSSLGTNITNDLQSEPGPATESDESSAAERTKSPKNQSVASLVGKISKTPASFLKKKSMSGTFPRSNEEKLNSDSAKPSKTQPLLNISETEPSPTESTVQDFNAEPSPATATDPIIAENASRHSRDRSLVNILDRVSRDPSFADDLAIVLKSNSRESSTSKGSKTSKHSREEGLAFAGRGTVKESTAEILVAMTKAPSRALDLSKYSQDPSLVSILYKVSKKPSLMTNLANVLQPESSSGLIMNAKTDNSPSAASGPDVKTSPKPTTDEVKVLRERSLAKVLMEVSKEPTLGTYLAKILKQKSQSIELRKASSKEESLAKILSTVSAQPSLAYDLANVFIGEARTKNLEESMRERPLLELPAGKTSPRETKPHSNEQLSVIISEEVSKIPPIALEPDEISGEDTVGREKSEKEVLPEGATAKNEIEESGIPVEPLLISEEIASTAQEIISRKILTEVSEAREVSVPEVVEETSAAPPVDATVKSFTDILLRLSRHSSLISDIVNSLKEASTKKLAENHLTSSSTPGLGNTKIAQQETESVGLPKKLSLGSNLVRDFQEGTRPVVALPELVRTRLEQSEVKVLSSAEVSGERSISSDSTGNLVQASKAMSEETSGASESLETPQRPESNESEPDSGACTTSNWQSQEGSREIERFRVNFETEPNQSAVGSERPEAEKLHRQEDLNESIKSRRSTDTRKSGDDETSIDSNKKKALMGSERSHLSVVPSKAGSSDTSTQSFFEEYYVKIQNENSVLQEYTGKLEPSDVTPGNTVKLKLLPRGSVAIDDINMEMQECLIRFDSKNKTGDLYVEANFIVGRKGSPTGVEAATEQAGPSLSVKALKLTDSAQSEISENSFSGKKPLYFVSESIEVDPETGKKVVIGKFVKDRNW